MSKLEEAAKEYLEDHVCSRPNCSYDAFKAGALYQAEQAKVLEDALEFIGSRAAVDILKKMITEHSPELTAKRALEKYRESK